MPKTKRKLSPYAEKVLKPNKFWSTTSAQHGQIAWNKAIDEASKLLTKTYGKALPRTCKMFVNVIKGLKD